MITVFYDGRCALCRREIDYYKGIAPPGSFTWIDITKDSSLLKSLGLSTREGLRILHVQDSSRVLHKGMDAFIVIWKALPRWKILAFFVTLPGIHLIADICYRRFADWRFKHLGYDSCDLS